LYWIPRLTELPNGDFFTLYQDHGSVVAQRYGLESPVSGRKLVIKDTGGPTQRSIALKSIDTHIRSNPGIGVDPVANGAYLQVYNSAGSGESACLPLPASGWTTRGDPAGPTHRYSDASFANGPCKVASVGDFTKIKLVCKASVQPIGYSLDEAQQGEITVRLISGGVSYCSTFTGNKQDVPGRFIGSTAAAPAACPVPPIACP
jgi:hypothetical protein